MGTVSEWVQAIAGVLQAVGIIFAILQVRLLRLQITTDHELARRSRAIDDVRAYINALDRAHPATRRLVDDFTEDQIDLLIKRTPFILGDGSRKIVDYALSDILVQHPIDAVDGGFRLNEAHLAYLLQLCSGHLNHLEIALLGWFNGISDSQVIEGQFRYVVSAKRGHYILERFREHEKVKSNYPAIDAFVKRLRALAGELPRSPVA